MIARAGMVNLVNRLRQMCSAEHEEYTLANTTYWTDAQLQTVLDRHADISIRERLDPIVNYAYSGSGGSYVDYFFSLPDVEEMTSGSAYWQLQNAAGSAIGTSLFTVNYDDQHIRFVDDTNEQTYYLNYRSYDLEMAASEVWTIKAAHVAQRFTAETEGHKLMRGQLFKHYSQMAEYYRSVARVPNRPVARVHQVEWTG